MKSIIILMVVLLIALYYIMAEVIWQLRNRLLRRRLVIGVLIVALLANQLDIMSFYTKTDAETVKAAEYAVSDDETTISDFHKLSDDIIEQTVPIGTTLEELMLPDTLEAVCVETDSNTGNPSENEDNTEDVTPGEENDTENEEPEDKTPEDETPESDPEDDSQAEEDDAEAENGETDDEEKTIETDTETFTESAKEAAMKAETGSFVMPEYQAGNVIEIKTLEDDLPAENSESETDFNTSEISQKTIIIENITWQSEPEYDGNTEGEYIFTAVLPEGYVLTNGVNIPQITVTVGGTNNIMLLSNDGIMTVETEEVEFGGGDGLSLDTAYEISTEAQLRKFADDVNSGEDYDGTYFKLTEDIELTEEWIPIAYNSDFYFDGIFDGGNHKIEGLTITSGDSPWEYCGLFGEVWAGTVQNLTVKGDINSTVLNTGGIVGRADDAKIINCSYEGTIISSSRDFAYIGGIAGEVYDGTKIINCRNKGDIEGSADSRVGAGGIVGYASDESEIINCKNEGSVNAYAGSESLAGGIVGWTLMAVTITDCRNTGSISAQDSYAGGIVGLAQVVSGRDGMYSSDITTIANCLNENEVQDSPSWGEIVGEAKRDNGTDLITIKNCYYKSGSGEAVGSGTENVDVKHVEGKSAEQFKSGEVAYLLQNPEQVDSSFAPQDGLVWGQNLGDDDFPGLVYFMEGDKAAKEVLKITFHDANATGYTPYETYINNGATIKAASGFAQISSQRQYLAETYETVGLSSEDGTGKIFREDMPITEDNTVLYLFYKEKFSSEDDTVIVPHGTAAEKDLDEQMKYAGASSAAGNFTYEITDGNGKLGASLSGSTLTIPATADIGSYTLTIKATEKKPTVRNLQKQEGVTIDSEDSVTFEVTVTVEKSDQDWIDEAIKVVQKALDEMNVTNETTNEDVQDAIDAALKDAGLEDVTATVGDDFNIKKATEESEGQITGTVTLEKGKEKGEVEIDKKIGKLGQTPGTTPEQTPQATVDRSNGKITDLNPGAKYDITYTGKDGKQHTDTVTADENGNLEIKDDWTGGDIDIVKKGNGTTTTDSDEQTLRIPTREKKPVPKTTKVSAKGKSDGKITNLEPGETYEISKDGGKTWETKTADSKGEITGLPAGEYQIRTKAKDNADGGTLCSEAADCKIGTKSSSTSGGSSESGGGNDNGGGQSDDSGGQSGDGSGSGQTDDTPEGSVTPPKDTPKKETPKKGTPKKETPSKEESKKDTGKTQEDSEKTEQSTKTDTKSSEETTDQTASTETSDDTIEITGDPIATGTIKDAENTTTILTVGEGSVSVTVISDEYSHAAGIKDTVAVANAVLTKEQIRHVNDGGKIEIRVEVKDISDQVSKEDKDIIEKGLAGNKITDDIDTQEQGELILGAYIDISMFIKIGDGDWDAITHAGEPIDVVIGIPDELQDDGRTFYVARCHEGEYALLHDMDTEAETITIQTELFSTYAIVYSQTGIAGITSGSKCNLCHICPTFLGVCCFIWLAIIIVAVIAVILIVSIRRKNQERPY